MIINPTCFVEILPGVLREKETIIQKDLRRLVDEQADPNSIVLAIGLNESENAHKVSALATDIQSNRNLD